jgi:hypothetical protein
MPWMTTQVWAKHHFPIGREIEAIDARDGARKGAIITGYYRDVSKDNKLAGIVVQFGDGDYQDLPFEMIGW